MSQPTHEQLMAYTQHYIGNQRWGDGILDMVGVCCPCGSGASLREARAADSGWTARPTESGEELIYGDDMFPTATVCLCPECSKRDLAA